MARAADIDAGHDAFEPVAPVRIGELMTAQAEAGIVILPLVVGLPELQERARDRLAVAREHEADQLDRLARYAGFNQFDPLGRKIGRASCRERVEARGADVLRTEVR